MPSLRGRLSDLWRRVVTPPAVREVEDADPWRAVDRLLPPPPDADPDDATRRAWRMRERLERLEHRNRELARLYDRRREEP